MELIAADPRHAPTLLELMHEFYLWGGLPWDPHTARHALTSLLEDERLGLVWIMQENDQAIGYIVVTFGYSLEFGGVDACIDELFILENYRGRGFGSQAIRAIIPLLKARGVQALDLEVDFDDLRAQAFYRSLGFELRDGYHLMARRL